jgi:5-methyltetrahydrofolate--homocysteine methyltransferase
VAVLRGGARRQPAAHLRERRPERADRDVHVPASAQARRALDPGLRAAAGTGRAGRIVKRDHVGIFVTTAGERIRDLADRARAAGEYLRSYALQVLALETAEAAAEWVHATMRAAWGFPDAEGTPRKDLFQAKYRGKRYSFGYPACPDLDAQAALFALVRPEEIGVDLTEGFMMEPEASVSALVFHHPDAVYFSAGASENGDE